MCTVSYVPFKEGYILTSNRDENPLRVTKLPNKIALENGTTITTPTDVAGGGSWIAFDETGRVACLLNGAFIRHIRKSHYRESRGRYVIEAFERTSFEDFAQSAYLEDIEPFTLLLIEPKRIQKLIWDGDKKYLWELSSDSVHLWSSATLYTSKDQQEKEHYFINTLNDNGIGEEQILQIHGRDHNTPFIINRHNVKTVSITQLVYNGEKSNLEYILKKERNEKIVPTSFHLS
ncbi:NRDE family protein [Muricauda sp. CAU 1633]|uniref:NRDE family protein n=1 Tax=Allomuricauda sp. CAU 1633 TaxID=2816036 RepID=UPI001A90448C|nr:NRDE family protein [Muricauda sp. CAU 1633]MBO0322266.1 NRDE family protein [Muricauda sp. CAU 1633]